MRKRRTRTKDVHSPVDDKGNPKIQCKICGKWFHQLANHLARKHNLTVEAYRRDYPDAPTMSEWASRNMGEKVSAGKTGHKRHSKRFAKKTKKPNTNSIDENILPIGVARLPILDVSSLDEISRSFIPKHNPHFHLDESVLETLALAIQHDRNIMLVGPNGCGKTSLVAELACLVNQPLCRINFNGDTRTADIVGEKTVEPDDSGSNVIVWKDGLLTQAMRNGWWCLLDELDFCDAAVLARIQSVLEEGHPLTLMENNGEVVAAHASFRIIATANTVGRGDVTGLHASRRVLDEATLDRFSYVRRVGYLLPGDEAEVVSNTCRIPAELARKMVDVATKIRAGFEREECHCTLSTRRLIFWGEAISSFGTDQVRRAANETLLDRLEREDRAYVKAVVDRVFVS